MCFSTYLNNIRDVQSKNNQTKSRVLEGIVNAKKSASKWKDYVNRRRKKKKSSKYFENVKCNFTMVVTAIKL